MSAEPAPPVQCNTRPPPAVEVPTLALLLATFAAWLTVTYHYGRWPTVLVAAFAAVIVTLHSSLQHEIVHGHPTRWQAVNRALGMMPLALWLPFVSYRESHLAHHVNDRLTDPYDDPESCYWTPEDLRRLGPATRTLLQVQQTLAGRVLIGSFWRIGFFLRRELAGVLRGDAGRRELWLEHLAWCVPVVLWLKLGSGMPLWFYVVAIVIPSNGILLIRSFAEHRARAAAWERTALVEGSWVLGPLFLFNNLHVLHHKEPLLPWYRYNARYAATRAQLIAANGSLVYSTYFHVARRYLFRAHDALEHPTGRVPDARARCN